MFYDFLVSTSKNITYKNRKRTNLKLARGTIVQVSILFPPGSVGLLFLRIKRGVHQLYPFNSDGYFQTSGESINFTDTYELDIEPYELVSETWNLDTIYDHLVHIRFNVLPIISEIQKPFTGKHLPSILKKLGL